MKTVKKILLKDNKEIAESIINAANVNYNNAKTLLSKLSKIGLDLDSVNDWTNEVEAEFRKDYPKADLDFCLSANGIKDQYREAEAFYLNNINALSFEALTDEQENVIREKNRQYAQTDTQIESYQLAHDIVNGLNRLKDLGIHIEASYAINLSPIFVQESRGGKIEIYAKNLNDAILNLK